MRALACIALAACAAPTGTTQSWPPAFGVTIAASTFADLDGDGTLDIAIAATGSTNGEGLYLVRGGTDWDGDAITSFTRFVPHPLADVAAMGVVGKQLLLAYNVKGIATLETLDTATLATLTTTALGIASKQQLQIQSVNFPGGEPHAVIIGDDAIVHLDLATGTEALAIPGPMGMGSKWMQPQAVLGFDNGSVAVATPTQVYVAPLMMQPITYTTVRPTTDTAQLAAITATTLMTAAGTPVPTILGVDPMGSRLCAIDVTATTGTACFGLSVMPAARFTMVAGQLDAMPATDISIVENNPGMSGAQIISYTNLVSGATLTSDGPIGVGVGTHVDLTTPTLSIVPPSGPGALPHLFGLGIDGQTICLSAGGC
jgi:hypothetical protein